MARAKIIPTHEWALLLIGDLAILALSLYFSLVLRALSIPDESFVLLHVGPFTALFLLSIIVFTIAGLYEQHTMVRFRELPARVFTAQVVNIVLAALVFFFVPGIPIAPKTTLVIFLIVSTLLLSLWRIRFVPVVVTRKKVPTLVVGTGSHIDELAKELNHNQRYPAVVTRLSHFNGSVDLGGIERILVSDAVLDDPQAATQIASFIFEGVDVMSAEDVYQEVFAKVPLTRLNARFVAHLNTKTERPLYPMVKYCIDLFLSTIVLAVFALLLPFIALAIRIESKGPIFITQARVGRYGKTIHVLKLRTMTGVDAGTWVGESKHSITKVGAFLRATSLDEVPQLIAVVQGKLSLIGPRSDLVPLAERMSDLVPFYSIRAIVLPGITGWAQIKQRYERGLMSPQGVEATQERLSYDLYYALARSLTLDIVIALRTIAIILSRIFRT
jgi:lipopolysaccharide/colanic/teichoic acid biosynthesis glycosyltransferase